MNEALPIGKAARAAGSSVRSLRYYEDEGLIQPGRAANGYRLFCAGTVRRARAIRRLLDQGLSTQIIREVLEQYDDVGVTLPSRLSPELVDAVHRRRERLSAQIDVLQRKRAALDAYLAGM